MKKPHMAREMSTKVVNYYQGLHYGVKKSRIEREGFRRSGPELHKGLSKRGPFTDRELHDGVERPRIEREGVDKSTGPYLLDETKT